MNSVAGMNSMGVGGIGGMGHSSGQGSLDMGPGGYGLGQSSVNGASGMAGLPRRGYTGVMPGMGGIPSVASGGHTANDLSALVNANLALAQQNLALAGTHTNPDSGYIRLGLGGSGGSGAGGSGSIPPPDMAGEVPRIHGSKRERAPSNPFLGTSFGVAGSFGSVFGNDYLSSTPDNHGMFPMGTSPINGMGSLNGIGSLGGMGLSPEPRHSSGGAAKMAEMAKHRLNPGLFGSHGARDDDFQLGSLGAMGGLDDALPLVGSMELGSPLENLGSMLSSLPKGSVGSAGGRSKLPIASEPKNDVQNIAGAFGQHSRQGGRNMDPGLAATDALSARVTRG